LSLRCKELSVVAAASRGSPHRARLGAGRGHPPHAAWPGTVSKFQPCLPEAAEDRLLAERLLDLEGTRDFWAYMDHILLNLEALMRWKSQQEFIATVGRFSAGEFERIRQ